MARDAGARKVYLASAAPPVRYPNIYGIDMPSAEELVANGRSETEIERIIGCDWLLYQDLPDLEAAVAGPKFPGMRSEEHTSELQSLMRISYAVFCLKKKRDCKFSY